MSKFLRDLQKIAQEEGYEYAGYAGAPGGPEKQRGGSGSGHHVFIHTASGAVMRTASTPRSESNALKYARANFRNAAKRTNTKAAIFRAWLLKRYKIGKNGSKVVKVELPELIKEFNSEHPDLEPMSADHAGVMIGQDPMFERIGNQVIGKHRYLSEVRISGPAYGLVKDEPDAPTIAPDPCGATFLTPSAGIAVCVLTKGHEGLHFDSFRKVRWAEGSGVTAPAVVEKVIDPVAKQAAAALPKMAEQLAAKEPVAEPTQTPGVPVLEPVTAEVSVAGLVLSDELADQLRAALGVPDAAMAHDAHEAAIKAMQDVQAAVSIAIDALMGVPVAPPRRGHQGGVDTAFGRLGQERMKKILAAVKEGTLEPRFTTMDVERVIGLTEGQSVSLLAKANRIGDTFRRVAPNTYELR